MKKNETIATRTTVIPGVYRLPTGVYEVWHRGRYVARTTSEADAIEIKNHAKTVGTESDMSLIENVKEARALHRSTKKRVAVQKKIRDAKYTKARRPRPTTNGRQLLDELPKSFCPKRVLDYLKDNGLQMPQTVTEWESGADDSTACSLNAFLTINGQAEHADEIRSAILDGSLIGSEFEQYVGLESLEKYAEKLRDEWVERLVNTAVFAIYGWDEDGKRVRDFALAKKLLDETKKYYADDEEDGKKYRELFEGGHEQR